MIGHTVPPIKTIVSLLLGNGLVIIMQKTVSGESRRVVQQGGPRGLGGRRGRGKGPRATAQDMFAPGASQA